MVGRGVSARQAPPAGKSVSNDLVVPSFADTDISGYLGTLDTKLQSIDDKRWNDDARFLLWDFGRQLQTGRLSSVQETRVLSHLSSYQTANPSRAAAVTPAVRMIADLTVGKQAPDIVGNDLNGAPLKLSDFRGKVVVLMFSGDWCGVCRAQYPYERQMLDAFKNLPFALLTVQSDPTLAIAKQVKIDQQLASRSWWDGGGHKNTDGPIATAWNVVGWPTTYVIDKTGVIRFVDLRRDDLVKAVRQLVN
jgi:peroxiredoxin